MDTALIAGRYQLQRHVGSGAHGEVWLASDLTTNTDVALKLLWKERTFDAARARREIAVLRLLRLPGVVRLLDDGIHEDRAFLVMDWVDGRPFPGQGTPNTWTTLAPATLALLEILAQVHATGVVHQDLKPANVLVGADGRTTLVDFSISRFPEASRNDVTAEGDWHGTPRYVAPEVLLGDAPSPAADLFAVGVMLFEALTGTLPWSSQRERLMGRAPSLAGRMEASPQVVDMLDRLLAPDPRDRPTSTREVLRALRGDAPYGTEASLWLGSRERLERAADTLASGRAVDVAGPYGVGRSRFLFETTKLLANREREHVALVPSVRPFGSLAPLVGDLAHLKESPLEEVRAHVRERLLATDAVVVADDVVRLDRHTASLIDSLGPTRPVLRAPERPDKSREVVELEPLSEADLLALFDGPDRLSHVREDAARLIYGWTGGIAARVFEALSAWVAAGIARKNGERYSISREALDLIDSGLPSHHLPTVGMDVLDPLSPAARDLAVWLTFSGSTSESILLKLTRLDRYELDAALVELRDAGLTRHRDGGEIEVMASVRASDVWPPQRIEAARSALIEALPPGHVRRLREMLASPNVSLASLIREGVLSARRLAGEGRFGPAMAVLESLAQVLRGSRESPAVERDELGAMVFGAWLELVSVEFVPARAERLLYELSRIDSRDGIFERLRTLTRAALDLSRDPPRALREAEAVGSFDDVGLERARANIRVLAARSLTEAGEAAVIDDVARWVEASVDATARARLLGWRGRLAYRVGKFDAAAELHLAAARELERPIERVGALTNAASALLEAFRPKEARSVVHRARTILARRSAHFEARLEWLTRAAAYRLGEPIVADLDLVAAVDREGLAFMLPLVRFTEAAIAWRAGDLSIACELATLAASGWRALRMLEEQAVAADALALLCGAHRARDAILGLADAAATFRTPGIGLQTLALLALSGVSLSEAHAAAGARLSSEIEPARRHLRMDILSAAEAERALGR